MIDWNYSRPESFGCLGRRRALEQAARNEGLWPLSTDHWRVIAFVKVYVDACGRTPAVVRVSRATGLSLDRLETLFARGQVVQSASRVVGVDPRLWRTVPCGYCDPTN